MNLPGISLAYLRAKPLATALNLLLLALGISTIAVLMLATQQIEERMGRDARGIDMVAGAKGSPMQLVLAAVFHLDAPAGMPCSCTSHTDSTLVNTTRSITVPVGASTPTTW